MISARRVGTLPRPSTRPTADITDLAGLFDLKLPRAACKGTAPLHDATKPKETTQDRDARHERAMALCRTCPEKTACLRARLADDSLGAGVFGGQLFGPPQASLCLCGHDLPHGRKYCSRSCKEKAATARKPLAPLRHVVCDCGTRFTTTQPRQKYCRESCRRQGQKQRRELQRQVAA